MKILHRLGDSTGCKAIKSSPEKVHNVYKSGSHKNTIQFQNLYEINPKKIWNKSKNFPEKILFIDRHFPLPRETFPCSDINTTEQRSEPYTFLSRPPSNALRKWWKILRCCSLAVVDLLRFFSTSVSTESSIGLNTAQSCS